MSLALSAASFEQASLETRMRLVCLGISFEDMGMF